MIKIKFYSLLKLYFGLSEVDVFGNNLSVFEVLKKSEKKVDKKFLFKLVDENEAIKDGVIILVNGENILHSEKLKTIIKDNDTLDIFPPGGGG